MQSDEFYILEALKLAKIARKKGEVPVGAVVVLESGKIVGKGFNLRESKRNALFHAEIIAINKACKKMKDWRLDGATLYVTLEPCMMCLGAALNARIKRIVFGAFDASKAKKEVDKISSLNHTILIEGGVCEEQCKQIIKDFFKKKRVNK